jgi:hypothetical protein
MGGLGSAMRGNFKNYRRQTGKTLLPDGKSYFPKTMITAKRLENSVCQGMKELGVNFRLYQKNPEEYPEI